MSAVGSNTSSVQSTTTTIIVVQEQNFLQSGADALHDRPLQQPIRIVPQQYGPGTTKVLNEIGKLPLPEWVKAMIKEAALNERGRSRVKLEYLPSEGRAAKTIHDFQKKSLFGERLTADQMDEMARTGYLTKKDGNVIKVSSDVQDSAKRFMADDAELFKKMESATDGKEDGELGLGDFWHALENGTISDFGAAHEFVVTITKCEQPLPTEAGAARTINEFQAKRLCGEKITVAQMDQIARTGYMTRSDGTTIRVPGPVRDAAKRFMANNAELFRKMESAGNGRQDGQLGVGDYFAALRDGKLCANGGRTVTSVCRGDDMLPSEAGAAKTMRDFQKKSLNGERLTAAQMEQMARTGYLTRSNGATIPVSLDVQYAARRFTAHHGALFRKMESTTDGRHDGKLGTGDYSQARLKGLINDRDQTCDVVFRQPEYTQPTETNAAKNIHDFQLKELGGEKLSSVQMDQMARTGYLTRSDGSTIAVPDYVQAAAQRFMANDGELFRKMESASNGRYDGKLGVGDYDKAIEGGRICRTGQKREVVRARDETVLPTASDAARTIRDFQQNALRGAQLSAAQMDQMARTGYLTRNDGSIVKVSPEVQYAAKRFMVNGAHLFRKIESATDGKCDGRLGVGDYQKARNKGLISAPSGGCDIVVSRDEYQLPSASSAARTIRDFQQNVPGGARLTAGQMDQMARTGYLTLSDGSTIAVPSAVQDAARRFMANGGALFKKIESAADGHHDGRLGVGDYDKAIGKGVIRPHPGPCELTTTDCECILPSESEAAGTMHDFQREVLDGEHISLEQMTRMAVTGHVTRSDGSTIKVPPEVQEAARRFLANGAELFNMVESATDGRHDGQLELGNYDVMLSKGVI